MFEKSPDDEMVRTSLKLCLMQSAENAMSQQSGMMYLTNEKQIGYVSSILAEIKKLTPLDEDTQDWVRRIGTSVSEAGSRKFNAPGIWYWVAWVFVLICFGSYGLAMLGVAIACVLVFYGVKKVYPYGWQINAEMLGAAATNSGLQ